MDWNIIATYICAIILGAALALIGVILYFDIREPAVVTMEVPVTVEVPLPVYQRNEVEVTRVATPTPSVDNVNFTELDIVQCAFENGWIVTDTPPPTMDSLQAYLAVSRDLQDGRDFCESVWKHYSAIGALHLQRS